jgi:hypothetical protein
MGGFLGGLGSLLGGFNTARRIDEEGFDFREAEQARQFARDRAEEEARQADENRGIGLTSEYLLGGGQPDDEFAQQAFGPEVDEAKRRFYTGAALGRGAQARSSLKQQDIFGKSLLSSQRAGQQQAIEEFKAGKREELLQAEEEIRANQQMSPREKEAALLRIQAQKELFQAAEAGRTARAGARLDLGAQRLELGRDRLDLMRQRLEQGEEGSKEAAVNAYGHLMNVFDSIGGGTFDFGPFARSVGGMRRAAASAGLAPDVKTYLEGVEGFAPLLARAAGHRGRLTDRDLTRTEALFPMPGDTTAEVGKKRALIEAIMSGAAPMPFGFEFQDEDILGGLPEDVDPNSLPWEDL